MCSDIMSIHDQFCSDIFKICTDISDSELQLHTSTMQIPQTTKHDCGLTGSGTTVIPHMHYEQSIVVVGYHSAELP